MKKFMLAACLVPAVIAAAPSSAPTIEQFLRTTAQP